MSIGTTLLEFLPTLLFIGWAYWLISRQMRNMPGGFGPGEVLLLLHMQVPQVLACAGVSVSKSSSSNSRRLGSCTSAYVRVLVEKPSKERLLTSCCTHHCRTGGPLSRMGGGKNGGRGGGGGFFGMAKANVTSVDKNAKDKV